MSSPDYDRVIAQEKKLLVSIKEHGEKLIPEFKQTVTSYIHDWSIQIMKSYLTSRPDITKNLSPQNSEEMKQEFTGILKALPEITSKRLDDAKIWLHRVEIPDHELTDLSYSYKLEKRSKKWINQALRDLIGLVGSLLVKYGYFDVETDYHWEMVAGGILQYTDKLPARGNEHYQKLSKLLEGYKNILIEYVYASQSLKKAEQAKKSSGA